MQQLNGDKQVGKFCLFKSFLKENALKLLSVLLFLIFTWVSFIIFFKTSPNESKTLQKIDNKLDNLKKETEEISIDRKVLQEVRHIQLEKTKEHAKQFIEEFNEINKIEDFKTRVNKKIKLYAKIN